MHEVLVNRLGGLSLPRKRVVRLTERPDMTLAVYRGRKTTKQLQQPYLFRLPTLCLIIIPNELLELFPTFAVTFLHICVLHTALTYHSIVQTKSS